jgi:hypothetical protein
MVYEIFDISLNLAPGNHKLNLYGIEICCDGGQQAQFRFGDAQFTTFSTRDILTPVPEPETYAMMIAGFGLMGLVVRRKNKTT